MFVFIFSSVYIFSDELMVKEIPFIIFSFYLGVILESVSKISFQNYFMESNFFLAFFNFFLDFMLVIFRPITLFGRIFVFLLMNHILTFLFFEVFFYFDFSL